MNEDLIVGFGLVVLGAICGGTFALPSKFADGFPWENLWGPFFLFVTLLIPIPLGTLLIKDVGATWSVAGWFNVMLPIIFGFLWGLGSFTNGIAFSLIGLSLAYAINFGVQTSVGSILPMILQHSKHINTPYGYVIISGIITCVIGVAICGYTGILKDRYLKKANKQDLYVGDDSHKTTKIMKGVIICVISGVLCACLNLAFSFGSEIQYISQADFGNSASIATLSVWLLAFLGGCISSGFYCAYLLFKNSTWKIFLQSRAWKVLLLAAAMAILHDGALFFYGAGTSFIGVLGTSIGFAVFTSGIMVVGNINGFLTKEWKGIDRKIVVGLISGVLIIMLGICVLAKGNSMLIDR
jgi:L-rhamnose-H+ transport protein